MKADGQDVHDLNLAIEASHLSKRYGRVWGLADCDLSIPVGSFTALVGANGAGKSTLLNLLVGLLKPTSGDLRVCGFVPSRQRREVLDRIGVVLQDRPLYPSLPVADLLEMGRRLNARWDMRSASRRLERLGIPLDRRAGKLSEGQRAQVSLSLALGKRPELLILDEPMASLDPVARQLFLDELTEVAAASEMAIIMSSHVLAELERVCDHVVVLQAGRVKACGRVEEVIAGQAAARPSVGPTRPLTDLEHAVLGYLRDEAEER